MIYWHHGVATLTSFYADQLFEFPMELFNFSTHYAKFFDLGCVTLI